jgi:membrane protease YdiL (CAAX protease family)
MASEVVVSGSPALQPIAPVWHFAVLLLIIFAMSGLGAYSQSASPIRGHRIVGYITVMVFEWVLTGFIAWGIHLRGLRLRDLISGKWQRWTSVVRDLGLAVLFLIVANVILGMVAFSLKAKPGSGARNLIPQNASETVVYLLLTLTAGVCEEIIFRGYLQRQFSAFTHSATAGLILQAIAFGIAHGYQGLKFMFIIAVFGAMFGLLAAWRCSLRPGIAAHFLQDAAVGLLLAHFLN